MHVQHYQQALVTNEPLALKPQALLFYNSAKGINPVSPHFEGYSNEIKVFGDSSGRGSKYSRALSGVSVTERVYIPSLLKPGLVGD